jgi:hypothetical protein
MVVQGAVLTTGHIILVRYTFRYRIEISDIVDKVNPFIMRGFLFIMIFIEYENCNYRISV